MQAHPAAELFPMLPEPELRALAEDIKQSGQREAIKIFEGQILDGRNRWRACEIAGATPRTEEWQGSDPWEYVWSLNAERRHLEAGQKVAIKIKFLRASEEWQRHREKERRRAEEERRRAIAEAQQGNRNAAKEKKTDAVSRDTASVLEEEGEDVGQGEDEDLVTCERCFTEIGSAETMCPQCGVVTSHGEDVEAEEYEEDDAEYFTCDRCLDLCFKEFAREVDDETVCPSCLTPKEKYDDWQPANPEPTPEPPKPKPEPKRERDEIAKAAGVSPATAARAIELEKKSPALFEKVAAGEVSLNKALATVKQEQKKELAAELQAAPPPPPEGPYRVIVLDPPWKYGNRAEDTTHRGRNQYPDMSQEELLALPVPALAEPDCALWLWTTNAFMRDALALVSAWGFTEKTILTWVKAPGLGLGDYLRNTTEHCIVATKGRPLFLVSNQPTHLIEPKREHSRKPEAFYALVEGLCPGSKLEMFARTPREGWVAWGHPSEIQKFGGEDE